MTAHEGGAKNLRLYVARDGVGRGGARRGAHHRCLLKLRTFLSIFDKCRIQMLIGRVFLYYDFFCITELYYGPTMALIRETIGQVNKTTS